MEECPIIKSHIIVIQIITASRIGFIVCIADFYTVMFCKTHLNFNITSLKIVCFLRYIVQCTVAT
jgi:hypothetical protein